MMFSREEIFLGMLHAVLYAAWQHALKGTGDWYMMDTIMALCNGIVLISGTCDDVGG